MKIDPETFDEWLAHPMTEALFRAMANLEEQAKQSWVSTSWGSGSSDPETLAKLRSRASTLNELRHMTAEQLENLLS